MSAVNALRKLLVDDVIVPLTKEDYDKWSCVLPEEQANYSYKIRSVPDDMLAFKSDKFPNTGRAFFSGKNNECMKADYVLVSDSEKIIMIFELMTTKAKTNEEVVAQLKGAKCILDYCASISSAFLNERNIFAGFTYRYYKIVFGMSEKRPFKQVKKSENSTPESRRILPGHDTSFKGLLGG